MTRALIYIEMQIDIENKAVWDNILVNVREWYLPGVCLSD